MVSESTIAEATAAIEKVRPTWQQTMLRIANPEKSLAFYRDLMGMTLIDTFDFPQWKFKLYFLTTLPQAIPYDLTPGTKEAHVRCIIIIMIVLVCLTLLLFLYFIRF